MIWSAGVITFSGAGCGVGADWWADTGEEEGTLMEDWRTGSGGPVEGVACRDRKEN